MRPVSHAPAKQPRGSVLVVDDEPTISEVLARYLERAGYRTRIASDGQRALALCAASAPDLVVLDIMLPGIDGLEVMRRLRERDGLPVRVILLTARGREAERIVGLRRGADDYVVKPFSPGELVARVEAVLRRERPTADASADTPALQFDGLRIEPHTRTVLVGERGDGEGKEEGEDARPTSRWLSGAPAGGAISAGGSAGGIPPAAARSTSGGREVTLTAREFDLLLFLAQHPGQVFSRDRLMELVWQLPDYSDSSTVTVHVRRLRAKLEPDPERPRYVQTVWGVGYRFRP
ncbi:MAG TPA: response regulator transcription factor [Solirubrobacteraceae bacterium]|nr:response regulator transcription factor [Solirubrobacteraceae bacterium]